LRRGSWSREGRNEWLCAEGKTCVRWSFRSGRAPERSTPAGPKPPRPEAPEEGSCRTDARPPTGASRAPWRSRRGSGRSRVEITISVRLDTIGDDAQQERARQMRRRRVPEHVAPAHAKRVEVEVLQGCQTSGRSPDPLRGERRSPDPLRSAAEDGSGEAKPLPHRTGIQIRHGSQAPTGPCSIASVAAPPSR
jgi:hypothetical protein